MQATRTWGIDLLGRLAVWKGEEATLRFRTPTMGHLLAYLAYHPKTHRREALIEHFWPDEDFEVARNRFRVDLSRLRDVLSELGLPDKELLVANREQVALKLAACDCDVSYFEALLKAARTQEPVEQQATLAQAVGLYTGPLLPGHDDDWVLGERQRLQELAVGALRQLVQFSWRQAKDLDLALDYARRTVLLDPLREEAHQDVLRLLLELRRPVVAREHYHRFVGKLRTELDCGPSKETEALLLEIQKQLHQGTEAPREGRPLRQNLPRIHTRFFGRQEELEQLVHVLAPPGALVSLVGFGGLGKTRLALEMASIFTHATPFWVPLADVLATDSLWNTLAGHLNQQTTLPSSPPSLPASDRVVAVLKEQAALLLLDNTEHLSDTALTEVLTSLRQRVPELRCLVTSRRRLGLAEEQVVALEPLSPRDATPLFVDRANQLGTGFTLTSQNQRAVGQICECLEGIPLAIEMAAARILILTPDQIYARLDKRFELLVNQNKDVPQRHQTLEATLDWSYRLLSPTAQTHLGSLGVFQGGWTLEAALRVCSDISLEKALGEILEASWITHDGEGSGRFSLLEVLRQFAWEKLDATNQAEVLSRHAAFFTTIAPTLTRDQMRADHRNLCLALRHFLEAEELAVLVPLLDCLYPFWLGEGLYGEGIGYLSQFMRASASWSGPPALLINSWINYYELLMFSRDQKEAEEILMLLQTQDASLSGADRQRLNSLRANSARLRGDLDEAQKFLEQSVDLDPKRRMHCLANLALIFCDQGDTARAYALSLQVVTEYRARTHSVAMASTLFNLANYAAQLGHSAESVEALIDAREMMTEVGAPRDINRFKPVEAATLFYLQDYEGSRALLQESLPLAWGWREYPTVRNCLMGFLRLSAQQGASPQTLQILGTFDQLLESASQSLRPKEADECAAIRAAAMAAVGPAASRHYATGFQKPEEVIAALSVGAS